MTRIASRRPRASIWFTLVVPRVRTAMPTTCGVPVETLDGDDLDVLVERRGDRWVLIRSGRLLANEVAVRLR